MAPPFRKSFDGFDQPDQNIEIPESLKMRETVERIDNATADDETSTDHGIITQTDAELNANEEQDEKIKPNSDDSGT